MRSIAICAAFLLSTATWAQSNSPLSGATPTTIIMSDGWQLTPQVENCVLTHANDRGRQDLTIFKAMNGDPNLVIGLPLFNNASYPGPVQLTIAAQTTTAQPIGRLTFRPVAGPNGMLLLARWPADQLLAHLATAARLNFFGPDQRLIRSVRMAGGSAAATSLQQCGNGSRSPESTPTAITSRQLPSDGGWRPQFDRDLCSLTRTTLKGNYLTFVATTSNNLFVAYRFRERSAPLPIGSLPAALQLRQVNRDGKVEDADQGIDVELVTRRGGPKLQMQGIAEHGFIERLRQSHWNALQLTTSDDPASVDDRIETAGSSEAIDAFDYCLMGLR